MTRDEAKEFSLKKMICRQSQIPFLKLIDEIYDDFEASNCGNCKLWVKSNNSPSLMRCAGNNGCEITGDKFYCRNWEKK